MKLITPVIHVCFALLLAACGGGGDLSIDVPGGGVRTLKLVFHPGHAVEHRLPFHISGGVSPYVSSIDGCPDWVTLFPDQGILAGTGPAGDHGKTFFCTYVVTDSATIGTPQSVSFGLRLAVNPPAPLVLPSATDQAFIIGTYRSVTLPAASGGIQPYTYSFTCAGGMLPSGMGFAPATRVFAGTPDALFRDSCTYMVMDSSQPAATFSNALEVEVTSAAVEPLMLPEDVLPGYMGNRVSLTVQRRARATFTEASGGVPPYTYDLPSAECTLPRGLAFHSSTRTLSGTPLEVYRGPDCTYRVTDSASPAASVSRGFELIVDPLDLETWRFRTRTVAPGGPCVLPAAGTLTPVAILPHAQGGEVGQDVYALIDFPVGHFLDFDQGTRRLTYTHPSAVPILGTPNTYRYLVRTAGVNARPDDALCLDIQFNPGGSAFASCRADPPHEPENFIHIQLQVRDDAFWDENAGESGEYRCPDSTAPTPRSGAQSVSNPVHTALAPVHARRAVEVPHSVVRARVRGWSPGAPHALSAISPSVDFASLSGLSEGFDYTGSSESLSASAELGAGSWQAGLVASFTRTDLRYHAAADLSGLGYHSGEHDTEIVSVHPFAAWHAASGGHLWASLGAGMGDLRHRDDLGFPSWSRSDVRLHAYAVGASVPLAEVLFGELDAEADIESFAFKIKGGGQISSSLPTLRGRDYRAGLAWSAPIPGTPFVSLAYRQLTGDGPEGAQLEVQGSVSVEGILEPRLSLIGSAEASFGLRGYEQDSWSLSGGVHFVPGGLGQGFRLNLDTRLMSLADGSSAGVGVRGEVGYGLWSKPFLGIVRPYVGLIRNPDNGPVRRTVGLYLRDTPTTKVLVEAYDHGRDLSRALNFTLRHRF